MIIKASPIQTASGHQAIAAHVLRGRDNEAIHLLRGGEHRLIDAFADAADRQRRYGIRHFSISPALPLSRKQAFQVIEALGNEFEFEASAATIVEHHKRRAGDRGSGRHWHLLVPEVDPVTGRTLSCSYSFARQEKIARRAELAFGKPAEILALIIS